MIPKRRRPTREQARISRNHPRHHPRNLLRKLHDLRSHSGAIPALKSRSIPQTFARTCSGTRSGARSALAEDPKYPKHSVVEEGAPPGTAGHRRAPRKVECERKRRRNGQIRAAHCATTRARPATPRQGVSGSAVGTTRRPKRLAAY